MADLISFIQKQEMNYSNQSPQRENGRYMKCVSVQQKIKKQKEEIVSSSTGKKRPLGFLVPPKHLNGPTETRHLLFPFVCVSYFFPPDYFDFFSSSPHIGICACHETKPNVCV